MAFRYPPAQGYPKAAADKNGTGTHQGSYSSNRTSWPDTPNFNAMTTSGTGQQLESASFTAVGDEVVHIAVVLTAYNSGSASANINLTISVDSNVKATLLIQNTSTTRAQNAEWDDGAGHGTWMLDVNVPVSAGAHTISADLATAGSLTQWVYKSALRYTSVVASH